MHKIYFSGYGIPLALLAISSINGCGESAHTFRINACPEKCFDACDDNGKCIEDTEKICPAECPDECDDNRNCVDKLPIICPDECPAECDDTGECYSEEEIECPAECPDECGSDGFCLKRCPNECLEHCDSDGNCLTCSDECPNHCDEYGECLPECPEACKGTCLLDGTCPVICPEGCSSSCLEDGGCPENCPEICLITSENIECSDECAECDGEGECVQTCPEVCWSIVDDEPCPEDCPTCLSDGSCPAPCPVECADTCVDGVCPSVPEPSEILTVTSALEKTISYTRLSGKKIVVIGNSQLYKGLAVTGDSDGYLHRIIKEYEGNEATVYNYTCGNCYIARKNTGCDSSKPCGNETGALGHFLKNKSTSFKEGIHYVITSGPAAYDSSMKSELKKLRNTFPKAKILFLIQEYDYQKSCVSKYTDAIKDLNTSLDAAKKIEYANWGKVAKNFYPKYKREDYFVLYDNNSVKYHHPNMLSGYITAATAYSVLTNVPASKLGNMQYSKSKMESYYKASSTACNKKFIDILYSNKDNSMTDIKKEINVVNPVKDVSLCEHAFDTVNTVYLKATTNTEGIGKARCSKCQEDVRVKFSTNLTTSRNVMKISEQTVKDAQKASVEDYMSSRLGNVFRQTADHTWGRQGYGSITNGGMASLCDGYRAYTASHTPMVWTIKSKTSKYKADGAEGGSYISLIGYSFKTPVNVDSFALFTADKAIISCDILGYSNGQWTVLYSSDAISYQKYYDANGLNTHFFTGKFIASSLIERIQIGVKKVSDSATAVNLLEFEVYGENK